MQSLDIALRHITETKHLLEQLIVSSESFDYPQAKRTVEALQSKIRELGRLKAEFDAARSTSAANICSVQFRPD